MKLYEYTNYEEYKEVQIAANHRKIGSVWEQEDVVASISGWLEDLLGDVKTGICHGTRRGKEQEWFRKYLDDADVIGTEISDTATQFPNTIQWDFHEVKDEWVTAFDFVYTNSLDHAYDPTKALLAWARCLKRQSPEQPWGGYIVIQCSVEHNATGSRRDPFSASIGEYIDMIIGLGLHVKELRMTQRLESHSWALFITRGIEMNRQLEEELNETTSR